MTKRFPTIQKLGFGFAALFLGVHSLDYVPGIMDQNGLMFGLFHMSKLIDFGHLALGTLALLSALVSAKASRLYFFALGVWYTIDVVTYFFAHLHTLPVRDNVLVNLPHTLVLLTHPGLNRVVLACDVPRLSSTLNAFASNGVIVEHIYDY